MFPTFRLPFCLASSTFPSLPFPLFFSPLWFRFWVCKRGSTISTVAETPKKRGGGEAQLNVFNHLIPHRRNTGKAFQNWLRGKRKVVHTNCCCFAHALLGACWVVEVPGNRSRKLLIPLSFGSKQRRLRRVAVFRFLELRKPNFELRGFLSRRHNSNYSELPVSNCPYFFVSSLAVFWLMHMCYMPVRLTENCSQTGN